MLLGTIRFAAKGWIKTLYVEPIFHFKYYGFSWVQPLPEPWIYVVFGLIGLSAMGIGLGCFYRASTITFFLLFTYVELLDKAYYLNHYYLVSVLSFLILWLPLNRWLSIDACWKIRFNWSRFYADHPPDGPRWTVGPLQIVRCHSGFPNHLEEPSLVPRWTVDVLRVQLTLVYLFAGIAKLQTDWLFDAMPMKIWLTARADLWLGDLWLIGPWLISPWLIEPWLIEPWLIEPWLTAVWTPYIMSWGGAFYDLTIPFFLLCRPTRRYAFLAVIGFHLMTAFLFPQIGMFPYIMIISSVLFFTGEELEGVLRWPKSRLSGSKLRCRLEDGATAQPLILILLTLFLILQLFMPMRHWLYPGNVLWTEEGFRYAWKVMLVEKTGRTTFMITDPATMRSWPIYPDAYLTPVQDAQMAYQPDMILAFAHFLQSEMEHHGIPDAEVRAESYVSYNGRPSRLLIDPSVDLSKEQNTLRPKPWILH